VGFAFFKLISTQLSDPTHFLGLGGFGRVDQICPIHVLSYIQQKSVMQSTEVVSNFVSNERTKKIGISIVKLGMFLSLSRL
jgi:hypothetical protein